jgi:hypothetical protein
MIRTLVLVLAMLGGQPQTEWLKAGDVKTPHGFAWQRDTWTVTDEEKQRGCWVAATWFDRHLVEIRCPAPFSPYGVTWQRFCVVKADERVTRVQVLKASRDLVRCEIERKEPPR